MNARAYYSDCDKFAAAWLRKLIADNLIAPGDVDERSIEDVQGSDLEGYCQCHFFAGIGGWSYALRLAGWPDDRPVWTGSCPCPSFSAAGKRQGFGDPRGQLWFPFFRIISECRPSVVFGEQVEGAILHGWLDRICDDLEGANYAIGAAVLPAACVGAPHRRHRLYWVADAGCEQRGAFRPEPGCDQPGTDLHDQRCGENGGLGHTDGAENQSAEPRQQMPGAGCDIVLGHRRTGAGIGGLGNAEGNRWEPGRAESGRPERLAAPSFWSDCRAILCRDGKTRRIPVERALFPLAARFPGRVGMLRGAGNSIVPQVAAEFIRACQVPR